MPANSHLWLCTDRFCACQTRIEFVRRVAGVIIVLMVPPQPIVSIVIPTYREADNIKPLVERVFAATTGAGIEAELIIVDDDSQDGTADVVAVLANTHDIRLIVRQGERGLSSAVLAGFAEARGDRFVVLDADLQHPPERIPAMVEALAGAGCDFVLGTRYGGQGGIVDNWPVHRRIISRIATLLAAPLAPLSDPMSGFFALPRATWERGQKLDPIGYKIALELYVKCGCRKPTEVPIRFETRAAGESKLSAAEQLRYIRHLSRLYRFRFPWCPWLATALLVGAVALVWWRIAEPRP